jgi:hypothetical protein
MLFISHRGNTDKIIPSRENSPDYILEALEQSFYVEIDIWLVNTTFYLGHDKPTHMIDKSFLKLHKDKLLLHCKDVKTFAFLYKEYHCFYHTVEDIINTSRNYIITHVDHDILENTICMMPEKYNHSYKNLTKCIGICSDVIKKYRDEYESSCNNSRGS